MVSFYIFIIVNKFYYEKIKNNNQSPFLSIFSLSWSVCGTNTEDVNL